MPGPPEFSLNTAYMWCNWWRHTRVHTNCCAVIMCAALVPAGGETSWHRLQAGYNQPSCTFLTVRCGGLAPLEFPLVQLAKANRFSPTCPLPKCGTLAARPQVGNKCSWVPEVSPTACSFPLFQVQAVCELLWHFGHVVQQTHGVWGCNGRQGFHPGAPQLQAFWILE